MEWVLSDFGRGLMWKPAQARPLDLMKIFFSLLTKRKSSRDYQTNSVKKETMWRYDEACTIVQL